MYGGRLAGKLDAPPAAKPGLLRVQAIHQDAPFTKTIVQKPRGHLLATRLRSWLRIIDRPEVPQP